MLSELWKAMEGCERHLWNNIERIEFMNDCEIMGFFFQHLIPYTNILKSVRVHFAYGSDGRSFFVEYS